MSNMKRTTVMFESGGIKFHDNDDVAIVLNRLIQIEMIANPVKQNQIEILYDIVCSRDLLGLSN